MRRLNSSCNRSMAFVVRTDFHWLEGRRDALARPEPLAIVDEVANVRRDVDGELLRRPSELAQPRAVQLQHLRVVTQVAGVLPER